MMDSGILITREVALHGEPSTKVSFSDLCKSGKIVNAYNALLMAEGMVESSLLLSPKNIPKLI